jgi:hypothetical protein
VDNGDFIAGKSMSSQQMALKFLIDPDQGTDILVKRLHVISYSGAPDAVQ